jgi:hypothetical protein
MPAHSCVLVPRCGGGGGGGGGSGGGAGTGRGAAAGAASDRADAERCMARWAGSSGALLAPAPALPQSRHEPAQQRLV